MRLGQIIDGLQAAGDGYHAEVPESWTQGRTVFGGLQAALLVRAMRTQWPAGLPLRSLQVAFVGPVPAGRLELRVERLRQGRSVTQMQGRILGHDGAVNCLAIAVFGAARRSTLQLEPERPAVRLPPEKAQQIPRVPGLSPTFTQFVEQRWSDGAMPFCKGEAAHTQIHLRWRDPPCDDESAVIALADAIPSPGLSVLDRPAPASSMTWTLEFLVDTLTGFGDGYWCMDAQATAAGDGYIYQTATLWSPQGRAIALSRQSTAVFG